MRSCEPMYISRIKSGQLGLSYLSYFPAAAYVRLVELYPNDLLDDTIQHPYFRPVRAHDFV